MACWIHPISGKGGGQQCSVLLPDRAAGCSPRRPAPSLGLRSCRRRWWQPKSFLGSARPGSRFTIRTLRHCRVLPTLRAWITSSHNDSCRGETEREHVNGIFQLFSNLFLKSQELYKFHKNDNCSFVPCRLNIIHSGISAFSICVNSNRYRIAV